MTMKTDELIRSLAADSTPATPLPAAWRGAVLLAVALAAAVFFAFMSPRHDLAEAIGSYRFLFKFAVTLAVAATALGLASILVRPGERPAGRWLLAALAPMLLAIGIAAELVALPEAQWGARMVGRNSTVCLVAIPAIGLAPAAALLLAVRHGAPTSPGLAGALAGLAAGGIAATFYALHCTDDSPLFVAVWYTIAMLGLAALGFLFGRAFARW